MFAMSTTKMDLVEQFRILIGGTVHDDLEFESFPKDSLLETYGLTLYAHKGTRAFRPTMIVELLRRSNPQLRGTVEVLESKEFPLNHPLEKKRGVRIITRSRQTRHSWTASMNFRPITPSMDQLSGTSTSEAAREGTRRTPRPGNLLEGPGWVRRP